MVCHPASVFYKENQPSLKSLNKVIYILIAFFLGGFGVQEFYAGRTGLGILCALFCWTFIPALWAWVRIFMALFRPADGNGMIVM